MDELDIAAELEQRYRDAAIAMARGSGPLARPSDFDGTCPVCETEIPPERIALSYFVCVDCVREKELKARLHV